MLHVSENISTGHLIKFESWFMAQPQGRFTMLSTFLPTFLFIYISDLSDGQTHCRKNFCRCKRIKGKRSLLFRISDVDLPLFFWVFRLPRRRISVPKNIMSFIFFQSSYFSVQVFWKSCLINSSNCIQFTHWIQLQWILDRIEPVASIQCNALDMNRKKNHDHYWMIS